jgi:hypothetical protein
VPKTILIERTHVGALIEFTHLERQKGFPQLVCSGEKIFSIKIGEYSE